MTKEFYFRPDPTANLQVVPPVCPLESAGLKAKKVYYIPCRDAQGLPLDECLRVVEGSTLYNQLLNSGTQLPKFITKIKDHE